jgi:hypothetical protein
MNADEKEREKYLLQEERVCSEEVERMRAEGCMSAELSERDKDTTSKREERESEYPGTTGRCMTEEQRMFRCTWGERARKREK